MLMIVMPTTLTCIDVLLCLGGSWTGNSNRPYCREVKFSWRRKQFVEGKNKKNWGGEDDIGVACCGCRRWSQDQDGCNAVED